MAAPTKSDLLARAQAVLRTARVACEETRDSLEQALRERELWALVRKARGVTERLRQVASAPGALHVDDLTVALDEADAVHAEALELLGLPPGV